MGSQDIDVNVLGQQGGKIFGNVENAVIQFTPVESYTTFIAEYAVQGGDYIVHFFPPNSQYVFANNHRKVSGPFLVKWQRTFPQILSPCAEHYFGATQPRLQAAYTAEMFSWWLRANGFALRLDPGGFITRFFDKLDSDLDAVSFLA